jgi:hypothetical protein
VLAYFEEVGVKMVVRLNEKLYDASVFEEKGIRHVEMVRTGFACMIRPALMHSPVHRI